MHKLIGFLVPTAVILLAVAAVAAQNGTADVLGGDEAAVRELLSRTLASYPPYQGRETVVQVGSLPEDLPFELDLSDDMRVIGSIQRGALAPTEIYIDSSQPPAMVINFFEVRFSGDDWKLVDGFSGGGFTTTTSDSAFYCNETLDTLVSISAFGYAEGSSDMRLYISPADNYSCAEADGSFTQDPYRLLPQLETPEGVTLLQGGGREGGGGSGFQSVSTQAYLETDLPLATITAVYRDQLEDFGWQPVGAESGEKLSWSGWTLDGEDQTWAGTLTLTASPTSANQYSAILTIQEMSALS